MSFKEKYQSFIASDLVRNASKLLSASVFAQAVGILIYPILTRLYSPEDFGLLSLFMSIGGILVIISTLEYQYAIIVANKEKTALSALNYVTNILLGFFVFLLATIPFSNFFANLLNTPDFASWYWALPLFVLTTGGWSILNYWHNRNKKFQHISTYQISKSLLTAAMKWVFGMIGFLKGGLIVATVAASTLSLLLNILRTRKDYPMVKRIRIMAMDYTEMRPYRNFPYFSLPKSIVNYASSNLPILLLTPHFGLKEMGFFGMALALSFTPINLIYNSIYQVLFSDLAEKVNNKQTIRKQVTQFIKRSLIVALPIAVGLYLTLPILTRFLLGEGWEQTGIYIQYMLPWLLSCLIAGSTCFIADIFMKQRTVLFFEVTLFITRLIFILIGIKTNNIQTAIIGFSLGGFVINTIQIVWFVKLIRDYENKLGEVA